MSSRDLKFGTRWKTWNLLVSVYQAKQQTKHSTMKRLKSKVNDVLPTISYIHIKKVISKQNCNLKSHFSSLLYRDIPEATLQVLKQLQTAFTYQHSFYLGQGTPKKMSDQNLGL